MYCIIQIETHRDRGIEEIYGPFDSQEEAEREADRLYKSPENYSSAYGIHYYNFRVREMVPGKNSD